MTALYRALLETATSTTEALAAAVAPSMMSVLHLQCFGEVLRFPAAGSEMLYTTALSPPDTDQFSDHRQKIDMAVTTLGRHEQEVLRECGRAWDAAWKICRDRKFEPLREFKTFFDPYNCCSGPRPVLDTA
jgi:crotonobetainyl-CoA:carnitine CoA-transferase CaiB-like acyl-CoA transferase